MNNLLLFNQICIEPNSVIYLELFSTLMICSLLKYKPGSSQVIAQYYQLIRLGFEVTNYSK